MGKQIPQTATAPTAALGSIKVTKKIVQSKFNNCGEFMHVPVAVAEPMQLEFERYVNEEVEISEY